MIDQTKTIVTTAEFLAMPETNLPCELIDGEVTMAPSPTLPHQTVVYQSVTILKTQGSHGTMYISPIDVVFDEENVPQPDVVWIAPDGVCKAVEDKYLSGAPDLIVEVLSPGTARTDKSTKFRLYEKHGVREYWMADPIAQFVEVWALMGGQYIQQGVFGPGDNFFSAVLGKTIDVSQIFTP